MCSIKVKYGTGWGSEHKSREPCAECSLDSSYSGTVQVPPNDYISSVKLCYNTCAGYTKINYIEFKTHYKSDLILGNRTSNDLCASTKHGYLRYMEGWKDYYITALTFVFEEYS